jgi:hypothetical protein
VRHLVHFLLQIRLLFFRCNHASANLRENQASGNRLAKSHYFR